MATTANYGWTTPDDTDLVKDGASAIRTLGSAIDTTVKANADATGLVHINTTSFSGVASQAVNNVFSATYRNYKILFDLESNVSDTTIYMKFRVGGVNNSTNYNWAMPGLTNTNVSSNEFGQNQTVGFLISLADNTVNDGVSSATIDLFKPFLVANTTGSIVMSSVTFASVLRGNAGSLIHENIASYDGVDFISSSGNITGSFSIYGYNN